MENLPNNYFEAPMSALEIGWRTQTNFPHFTPEPDSGKGESPFIVLVPTVREGI